MATNDNQRLLTDEEIGLGAPGAGAPKLLTDSDIGLVPKRTWGEAIKDTGAQLAEGVNTTLGAIPSAIAPQSKAAGFFRDNADHWRDQQSDVLKGRIAETDKRIQEAGKDGLLSQIGAAASEYWNDPAQAARLVATNLPSMAATLGAGAAAGLAARGVAAARGLDAAGKAALAAKYGTTTAAATNTALNAGGARGEAFEDLQKTALAQGMTPEQAEQAGVSGSILPGVVGGVAGAISGKIGLEKAILGQATTGAAMRKAAGAFGAELAGEQIEELAPKVATNYQVGQIDPARGLTDGLGRTMVETAIGSGPGAVVAGGAAGMRSGDQPPVDPVPVDPTTSPGAADPNAPQNPPATPPEAPDLTTTAGAGVQRDGLDFTRDVDTSGLSLQDPAEVERARAATMDYEPTDTTPQWDTQPGAAQSRQGLDMPAPDFDTGALGFDPRPLSERMGLVPAANTPLTKAAALSVDTGASPVQFLGATGRDMQLRQTGPGVADESNVIDVQGRVVEDRAIDTPRRLIDAAQPGASQQPAGRQALPAPANLREALDRIRQQRAEGERLASPSPAPGAAVPALGGPVGNDRAGSPANAVPDGLAARGEGNGGAAGTGRSLAAIGTAQSGGRGNGNPALTTEAPNAQTATQATATRAQAVSTARPGAVETAWPATIPATTGVARESQANQAQQGSPQSTQAGGPQAGAATAAASTSPAEGNRVQAAGLTDGAPTANTGAQAAPTAGAQAQTSDAAPSDKAKWIKAAVDKSRLNGSSGVQLTVTPQGEVTFSGDPRSTKDGRALLATYEEALRAGATKKEIADALMAARGQAEARPDVTLTNEGDTTPAAAEDSNANQAQTTSQQAQVATESGAPEETREQRAQRVAEAGESWTRMPTVERQALAARAAGLNPIQRKNVPKSTWADLNSAIQRKLADAMDGRAGTGKNQGEAPANQTPAATTTATVAQQRAAVSEPLPPTDIRMGDKVIVDGEMYTVTGPLKEGRKSVGVVADRDADTDPLMGVRQVFLRGDDAIRAKIAANSQSNEQAAAAQQAPAATETVANDSAGQDEKAIRYELPPEKSTQQPAGDEWMAAQSPSFKPTARQQLLMDAVAKALDDGAFYNSDVNEHVAKALGVTPEQRARNSHNVDGGDFGYDVYGARKAVEAQRSNAKSREFANALNLNPGDALGTLIFNDGKVTTGVKVIGLNDSGLIVTFTGKRGSATLNGEVGIDRLAAAMDRAKERGKRSDGYVEFVESKVAPIDAAEQEPTKATAPAAKPAPAAAPSENANSRPGVVNVPPAIEAAFDADMQAQKARITRLRNAATADGMSLDDKRRAQTQLKGAEFTLQTMRRTRFDAEDAAIKAIEQKDMAPFAEHITFFKTEKALQELIGAAKPQAAAPATKKKPSADQTRAKADLMAALADLGDILGKNTRMNIVPEQEQKLLPVLTRVLDAAFRLGYHKFKDSAKFALDQIRTHLGDDAADALTLDHMQGAYIAMAGGKQGADTKRAVIDVESKAEIEAHEAKTDDEAQEDAAAAPDAKTLTESLYQAIGAGNMPKDNPALKKLVEAFDGKPADPARMKQAQEELETAIAMSARDIVAKGQNDKATFDELLRLYESQPSLNIRTSTSVANQAYSTPAPLAFIASRLAGITRNTVAHEPTGGTGMLLIGADPKKALVNELNDLRISALKAQGFAPTQLDAATMRLVPDGVQPDAVVTNPPFGSIKDADGKPVKVKVDGYNIGQIDHLIAARALQSMKDDGKATLILGANKVAGGLSTDDRIFFNWLYSHYNVVGHFEVEGDLYNRQGAGWPVRVITINGRKKSSKFAPVAGTIQRADNWSQVYEQFTQSLDAAAKPATGEVGGGPAVAIEAPGAPGGRRPQGSTGSAGNVAGTSARVVPDRAKPAAEPVATVPDEQRLNAQSFVPQPQPGQSPSGAERPAKPAGNASLASPVAAAGNEFQTPYVPRSARKDEGVLIPSNMAQPTQDALNRLEDAVGDIDEFARKELGYESTEALHNALMGLQVDSVATAIYQIQQGKAAVIADQTGIGKGRQAASIIRWAARNGMTPVFVSVKPSLFTDMYGDLADIGTHDVAPFILNSTEWVSGADGEKLFANKPSTHRAAIQSIVDNAALPQGRNALFMTYSQINTANLQRQALMALAPNAVFVLDESHNAAGDSGTGDFMISVLKEARGVTYLSATYAKRPDNMPLYFKTDIGDAAADSEGLADAMAAGGLPLQTVVSNNLVKAGQMFRRERSYDGVSIASTFDTANRQLHERLSDEATEALRAIVSADKLFHSVFVKSMDKALKAEGSKVQDNAGNQVSAGVQHTEFSSVVHNFVRQMLLGLKAQTAADEAIASLKRGEKPIIAVENTMGSFLSEYAAQNNINQGDSLGAFDYRTVLSRALERSRVINVVLPTGDKSKQNIPLSELDPITRKAYDQAQAVIDRLAIDIPVSPIDWMRAEIARAGFSVAEITGRDLAVDYSNPRKPVLSAIDLTEQRDKVASTRRFNGGELDALILNVAGSTGISLHASEKFADQRQRHMIVAQAAGDINIFMQMLGRVHRTGQVRLPKYTILSVDLPTEKRPTAVLSRKMKSLNANTSSNTESATSVKTADILNKYGDQIVNQYLVDNLELARQLGVDDLLSSDGERVADDIARKATGRLALQPIEVQRAFYEDVEAQYDALIEYLNKTNQNDLEPRTFDFDAKELRTEILFDGPNKTTPFGEDAVYGEYSIKAQGVAMKPEEIQAAIAENLQGKTGAEHAQDLLNGLLQTYVEQTNAALAQKAGQGAAFDLDQYAAFLKPLFGEDGAARMTAQAQAAISTGTPVAQITARDLSGAQGVEAGAEFLRNHAIGKTFRVEINSEPYNAVITNVRNTHKTTGNPFSLSKFQITLAVNGALRSITVPATQFRKIEVSSIAPAFRIETLFKEQPANQRETAKIVTGNLLAAYGELKGVRGTIISFTKSDGTIEQGILLPKLFDFSKNTQGDYRLRSGADALKFLQQSTNKDIGRFGIATRDGQVRVLPRGDGVQVRVPKSKAQGARYFLDKNLIAAAGDFVSSANAMVANVDDAASAEKVLDMLMDKQALYALPSMADEAKSMAAKPGPDGGAASFSRAPTAAPSRADSNARNVATQMLVDGLKAKWTRAPEIIVARNMQDAQIPQAVRDYDLELKSQGATGEARGFIYKGKVYLLSDELKGPQQIAEVLFHEVLGHYGLRGAFGDSLNSILQQMGTMRRRDVVAKAREYGLFNKDALGGLDKAAASDSQIWAAMSAKDRLSAAEEVLAEMAQSQPTIGFVQRAIAAIRNWLRANVPGFDKLALTDADIVQAYILPARGYVTRSNETAQQAIDRAMLAFSRAYHGTPHRGIEKFSTDKIGTGEGAQAYGWGLYFASKREIADHYRRKLSGDGAVLDGIPASRMPWYYANLVDDIRNGKDFYQSKAVAISIAQELLQREQRDLAAGKRWATQAGVADLEGHVAALQRMTEDSYEEHENLGQLYEVEIPEDSEMLLWDRPLSEQPEKARKALESRNLLSSRMTGEQLYKHLKANPAHFDGLLSGSALTQAHIYPDQGASMFLSALGIKGIKYLDGDSRNAGEGSYNYVIFNGDDVQIERAHFSRTSGDLTQTENFRRWFAGSKVVENGLEELLSKPDGVGVLLRDLLAAQNATGSGLNPVQALMLALAKNDKIGRGIVGLVPVDVVNSFSKDGLRPKDGGGNTSMFVNALNAPVSDQVLSTFRGILTSLSTKLANAIATGRDQEIAPALLASDFNLREVGGLLSLQGSTDFWGGNTGVKSVSAGEAAKSTSPGLGSPAKDFKLDATALADLFNKFVSFAPHAKTSISDDLPSAKYIAKQGKPLVVYHGTSGNEGGDAFTYFDAYASNYGLMGQGAYFTDNPDVASSYTTKGKGDTPTVYKAFLSIQNPIDMDAKAAPAKWQEQFDGIEDFHEGGDTNESWYRAAEDLLRDQALPMWEGAEAMQDGLRAMGHDGITHIGGGRVKSDGVRHRVYIAFDPTQIKSAIGNNGNFDPNDPDIRFSRATEAAKAAGDAIKSVTVTNIKKKAGFKLTDYLGIGLQALGRRQIVDIYGDLVPLAEYNRLVQQMEADKNEGSAEADQLVTRWAKLSDEGKLANLMHDATLAQIDPAKPYVDGDDKARYMTLQGRFNALTDAAKQVYTDTRDSYQAHHAKVRSAIKERIERSEIKGERKAALLKQMDDEFFKAIKGVYFPLARFGQYAVTVKGPDGKVESVSRAETKAEAEALRSNLLSAFPRDKGFTVGRVMLSKDFIADRDAVGRGFMTELYQVLDKQDMDAAQRAELEDTLGQLYLSSLPDLSWAKHGIHRKGTPGFSQDARRAYAQNMFHGARYLAKLRYSDLMQDELTAMQKHVDDWREVEDFDQNSAQRVVDEMNKRHESLMNPKSNPLSTALTSLGFVFHLGLSPASAMVNLSQTALVAYPIMGAKWGFNKASAALLKASKEAAAGKNDITGSLNADERAAYDEAVRAGTIDVTMAHDLAGIAQGEDAGVMWKIRPVMRWASFLFHHAERFNRQVTFVASYRLARDAGADQKSAFEQATKATYDGHFDYGAANRPRIMQGNVAKVLLLFKQYGQNMVYTLSRNAYQSIKGADDEKAEARKALAGLLASHAMAAGVLGLPMVTTLLAAASMIGGDDDEPWDAKVALQNMLADAFGQKPAEVLAHGLSRLTPWDISGRVGLDRLIFPDVQEGLEGQRLAESAMAAALGPVAGIGVNVLKGMQMMGEGRYAMGLEAMMPAALRGPVKALRYAEEGVQDKSGISILDEVSPAAVAGQALGFSPSAARNAQEGKSAILAHDRALGERRQELLTKIARATMAKDEETKAEAREEIRRFNEKNPGRRINPNHIMASVRGRQKRIDQAQDGVYLPRNRREAMEAGRFATSE